MTNYHLLPTLHTRCVKLVGVTVAVSVIGV